MSTNDPHFAYRIFLLMELNSIKMQCARICPDALLRLVNLVLKRNFDDLCIVV